MPKVLTNADVQMLAGLSTGLAELQQYDIPPMVRAGLFYYQNQLHKLMEPPARPVAAPSQGAPASSTVLTIKEVDPPKTPAPSTRSVGAVKANATRKADKTKSADTAKTGDAAGTGANDAAGNGSAV